MLHVQDLDRCWRRCLALGGGGAIRVAGVEGVCRQQPIVGYHPFPTFVGSWYRCRRLETFLGIFRWWESIALLSVVNVEK